MTVKDGQIFGTVKQEWKMLPAEMVVAHDSLCGCEAHTPTHNRTDYYNTGHMAPFARYQ